MPSFTGKTFSSFYANILSIDQASNIGIDTVVRGVMDGVGNSSALQISDDQVRIRHQNDDGTTAPNPVVEAERGPTNERNPF